MWFSPLSGRVRFTLEVKGLAYTQHVHTPGLTDWQLQRKAPKVQVPTLIDGATVIQETAEILDHLERRKPNPPLYGKDAQERAAIERYVALSNELFPDLRADVTSRVRQNIEAYSAETPGGFLPSFMRVPIAKKALDRFSDKWNIAEGRVADARDRLRAALRTIAVQLNPNKYLVGDKLSHADIAIAELGLLFRPPGESWVPGGPATRKVNYADWLDDDIAHRFEVWRDALYRAHRTPRSARQA